MTTCATPSRFTSLSDLLQAQGLPQAPLPIDIAATMHAHGVDCFASRDLMADWRGGAPLHEVARRWLEAGNTAAGARCELTGLGFHSHFLQLAIETPRYGLFARKLIALAFDDAAINRRRVEGTFGLMRALLDAIGRARAWPADRRLVVIENDESGLLHWGWVAAQGAGSSELTPDAAAWIAALIAVEAVSP